MLAEAKVGYYPASDSGQIGLRADKSSALVNAQGHGDLTEPSYRGTLFVAQSISTGIQPVASTTWAASTLAPVLLWNPVGSNKSLSITKAVFGWIGGTYAVGQVGYGTIAAYTSVPSTGTEVIPSNCNLGLPRGVGRFFYSVTVTAGQIASLRPSFTIGTWTSAAYPAYTGIDDVKGEFTVPPGTALVFGVIGAAGTSPTGVFGLTWEEIPA